MDDLYNTLVISGGSVKAISALGALFYLEEQKHTDFIINYSGVSAGALICYFLCLGYSSFDLIHFLCKSNFIDEFQNLNLSYILERKGIINFYVVQEYLEKLTLNKIGFIPTFKELRIKFGKNLNIITYNLTKNKIEYLNAETTPDMSCLTALRMSISVPILFDRFFYNNCEYLDGGLVDNFPVSYFDTEGNNTIGINIAPYSGIPQKQSYIQYLLQIAMIPYHFFHTQKIVSDRIKVIEINTETYAFDFNLSIPKRLDLFSKGYQDTKISFEKILNENI